MKRNDTYLITPDPHQSSPAEIAKRLGITEEQLRDQARKQPNELLIGGPEKKLTPRKLEQIRKAMRKAEEAKSKAMRKAQRTSELPFPLPDKYKNDGDSLLPRDALEAVNAYRLLLQRFGPDRAEDEDQLKKATDVALGIRLALSDEYNLELAEVPLAKDFKRPTDEDFARLEQWFLTAANAIKNEIAKGSEAAAAQPASDARQGGGQATGGGKGAGKPGKSAAILASEAPQLRRKRKKRPGNVDGEVLTSCRRRCCLCFGLKGDASIKPGQIGHLDRDPSNNDKGNLAYFCFEHHDEYDSRTSQSKGLTIEEVRRYRDELYRHLQTHLSD